jgi:hypothetical protein
MMRSSAELSLGMLDPDNALVLSPRVNDMAAASARRRLDKKLSGDGSPGLATFSSSMRESAPALMQHMNFQNRPSLMVPGDGDMR